MSIVSLISDRLSVITEMVESGSLDLSPNQIAELEKLINLIQLIISDGITENEINGLLTVIGIIGQMLPSECQSQIAEIRKEIVSLKRDMFNLDGGPSLLDLDQSDNADVEAGILDDLAGASIITNHLKSSADLEGALITGLLNLKNDVNDIRLNAAGMQGATLNRRLDVSEKILMLIMDHMILPNEKMGELSQALKRIERLASRPNAATVDPQSPTITPTKSSTDTRV